MEKHLWARIFYYNSETVTELTDVEFDGNRLHLEYIISFNFMNFNGIYG